MAPRLLFVMLGAVFYLGVAAYEEPKHSASLKSLHVITDIKYRFATTRVSMKYYNPYNSSVSANLHVNMPRNSFISNFSMEIDGNVTVGEVKEKEVAKDIYEDAVERGQSAGYIEVKHRFTNVFDLSVNVEPQKYIVYNLTYQELLTRQNNKYRHVIHLSNGGIIDNFLVEVFITEPQDIIDVFVPEIKDDKLTDISVEKELDSALIEYINSREVYIKYNPSRKQQEEISEKDGVAGLLRVEYDVDRQNNSNLIYAVDGYFVHFFTSDSIPSLPKNIIFMLDVSGSMSGRKIKQLKEAMENILDQLDPELDRFLIGKFSSDISWMTNEFLTAHTDNKKNGKMYIQRLIASGATNINSALLQSIEKHKAALSPTKKSIIIFLTDGDPTVGITDLESIKKNVREANQDISLFALCFGENCDSKFLREIATENGGFNRKIYIDSDSKLQIENLYKEISNILLKDITFVYLDGAVNTSSTSFSNYFKGSELVVSGVLSQEYQPTINVSFTMTNCWGFGNEVLELDLYGDDFAIYDYDTSQNSSLSSIQSFSEITEKTYVYLTLQQLLKEDRTEEVRHDILNLALKYNFVTPLTSMVVTKSKVKEEHFEEDEDTLFLSSVPVAGIGVVGPYPNTHNLQASHVLLPMGRPHNFPHTLPPLPPPSYGGRVTHNFLHTRPPVPPPTYGLLATYNFPPYTQLDPQRVTTTTTTTTTATTTTRLPLLPHSPGILIKALNCSSDLCFTDSIQCRNQTEILLLADTQAGVFVYGQVKKASNTNCLETLNKIITRRAAVVSVIVPEPQSLTGVSIPKIFIVSPTIMMTVNQYESVNAETFLSVHFTLLGKFERALGILNGYTTEFQCIEKTPNQMVLSNNGDIFNKVNYKTASGGVSHCFTM